MAKLASGELAFDGAIETWLLRDESSNTIDIGGSVLDLFFPPQIIIQGSLRLPSRHIAGLPHCARHLSDDLGCSIITRI